MFRKSNSRGSLFLQREIDSKENALTFQKNHDYANCCNFKAYILRLHIVDLQVNP